MKKSPSAVFRRRAVKFSVTVFLCLLALLTLSAFRQENRSHAQDELAAPITFSNAAAITIPAGAPTATSGPAAPYPSAINVANVIGVIDKVTVKLNNFTHTFPGDVDIMLVGPAGQNVMLMSDAGGGTDVNGITLTFDDAAANPLPATLVSGTFKPTNIDTNDPFPAPAPAPTAGTVLSVFHRTNPNGFWRLFVVDDAGTDVGAIVGGWELNITIANQFENAAPINFPSSGSANPYPSSVTTASLAGNVVKIQVKLNNFSHTSPDDVDILLVSPSGRSVVLMSDVGGANPVNNLSLTFDDTAAGFLPDSAPLTAGTYKPTDFEPGDAFPA
ncbi:MAG TPA: proprotein convertase P-domain-containing protein, partial [Pyrinomonadaceae bacterium]